MVFSSLVFLFAYLPLTLAAYYIVPLKWRNIVLLLLGLVFYGWGEPVYIIIMFVSIAIDYTHGMLVSKCKKKGNIRGAKLAVFSSVFFNLALLVFFKYFDFFANTLNAIGLDFIKPLGIALPIGISFYTFQTMSYTIDVYRGDADVQKNIASFGMFVTLFPQLIAGPIIKYKEVAEQIDERSHTVDRFASGIATFCAGLAKKVLIANNVGALWDTVIASDLATLGAPMAWLGIIAYAFQIYFDFSGYSDMAIGLGRMFGFEFIENFNYPYISRSITEFWRRWHISLGSFFREYVYIPLGGNRKGLPRQMLNMLVVWALTGFWHGASWNFLIWGLWFFVFLAIEKLVGLGRLEKIPSAIRLVGTLLVVLLGWVLFAVEDFGRMGLYLRAMFAGGLGGADALYYLMSFGPILLVAALGSTPVVKKLYHKIAEKPRAVFAIASCAAVLVISTAYLVNSSYNPFLYFRF